MASHTMAQSSANPAHPTIPQLKPSVSQALWGHLRSMNVPPALQDKAGLSAAPAPIAPVDRAGTSMRMLLHDTQATLEKFAGHVEGLACRVDEARREVATAHKVFLHGQEKTVEENIKLVNRCQTEIQKSLGKPAQASALDETHQTLTSLDRKVDALDRRVDALQMLNQTQLQTLQAIQDQQIQLLTALAPVLPLLQAIPLHIDTAKANIKDTVRDAQDSLVRQISAKCLRHQKYTVDSHLSSRYCSPRKRRRMDGDDFDSSDNPAESGLSGSTITPSPWSPSRAVSPVSGASSRTRSPSPLPERNSMSMLSRQASSERNPSRLSVASSSASMEPLMTTDGSHFDIPSSGPATCAPPPTAPVERRGLSSDINEPVPSMLLAQPQIPTSSISISPRASQLQQQSDPTRSVQPEHDTMTASPVTLSPSTRSEDLSFLDIVPTAPSSNATEASRAQFPGIDTARSEAGPSSRTSGSISDSAQSNFAAYTPQGGATNGMKPMSLRDRRARGLLSDPDLQNAGKRFILFEDEDEDDEWDD